jgi:hypothetical protein
MRSVAAAPRIGGWKAMDYLFTNNRIKLLFNFTTNKHLY